MIRRVEIRNYRCLRNVSVGLGEFQVAVGPNGAGKSTFFDAIRFVGDILGFGLEKAVYGDARLGLPMRARDPRELTFMRNGEDIGISITAEIPKETRRRLVKPYPYCTYSCAILADKDIGLRSEGFWLHEVLRDSASLWETCFSPMQLADTRDSMVRESRAVYGTPDQPVFPPKGAPVMPVLLRHPAFKKVSHCTETDYAVLEFSPTSSMKSELAGPLHDEEHFPASRWFTTLLTEGVKALRLDIAALRMPSPPEGGARFRADGSNFPWAARELRALEPDLFQHWVDHIGMALRDVVDIDTFERPEDKHCYLKLKYTSGLELPSWTVSDGSLRLLALTFLAYSPHTPNLVCLEEPENGVHPQVVETIHRSLSSVYDKQVICATHSPIFIASTEPDQLLCFIHDENDEIQIVRADRHPRLRDWHGPLLLGEAFAMGELS